MRTKFTANRDSSVTIEYDNALDGSRVKRTFYTNKNDGLSYVYYDAHVQICEKLLTRGGTLISSKKTLLDTIRREYRRMREYEKKVAQY